jgi:2-polyprenyl-3-methyl-5-hydroxy-6-metoxy-1,4-benzoquinol methylase
MKQEQAYFCQLCNNKLKKSRFRKRPYALWICNNCSFAEIYPKPLDSDLREYYNDMSEGFSYNIVRDIGHEVKKQKFENILLLLEKNISKFDISNKKTLDIGCGEGIFLSVLKERGVKDCYGIEISKRASQTAIESKVSELIFYGTIEEYSKQFDRKYSLITLFDVIEHIGNIDSLFVSLLDLLEEDGIIVIATPYINSIFPILLGSYWPYFNPPEHISYFSKKSMACLSNKYSLSIIDENRIKKVFSLRYFSEVGVCLSPFLFRFPLKLMSFISKHIGDFHFSIYVGETLTVMKRKS